MIRYKLYRKKDLFIFYKTDVASIFLTFEELMIVIGRCNGQETKIKNNIKFHKNNYKVVDNNYELIAEANLIMDCVYKLYKECPEEFL